MSFFCVFVGVIILLITRIGKGRYEDLSCKCSSMSHEVYVWDIGVDSLKYTESKYISYDCK